MQRFLVFSIILFLISSCKKDYSELSGHWVSTEYFQQENFYTIDFEKEVKSAFYSDNDSIYYYVVVNKNSLSSPIKMSLADFKDGYEFFQDEIGVSTLKFKNGRIEVRGDVLQGDFIRMDDIKSIHKELFNYTDVIANLPSRKEGDASLQIRRSLRANLNIGHGRLDPLDFDSVRINVNDVYISFKDIPIYIIRSRDNLPESERSEFTILLNADSLVKEDFLQKVIKQVNTADSTLKIYQSTYNYEENKVYYRRRY